MHISLIGQLSARDNEAPIALPKSKKARALLGYLALNREGASREELSELLFAETKDPKASLRWALSRLKMTLPELILDSSRPNYLQLDWSRVTTDVERLQEYLRTIRKDRSAWRETARFESNLNGHVLDNLAINGSVEFENWRLANDGNVHALHEALLYELLEACDEPRQRVDLARHLVHVEPLSEHGWAELVRALLETGQLQQAQHVHDLAAKQFLADGTPLQGELDQALMAVSVRSAHRPTNKSTPNHRATLAVLPCVKNGDAGLPATLQERVTEALHASATANRACAVMAWSISNNARQDVADGRSIGSDIGADLVLQSRLRPVNGCYQLVMELLAVDDGTCLFNWTQDFERCEPEALAEKVTTFFSARFEIDLQLALIARALARPPEARGLWDEYFLALPRIYAASGHDPVESLELLQRVISREPSMGPAVAAAAWVRTTHPQFNQSETDLETTASLARRAIELCQDDTFVVSLAAIVIATTERDLDTALDLVQRAQRFNPHSTMSHLALGAVEHYRGNHAEALRIFEYPPRGFDTEPLTFALCAFSALCCYFLGQPQAGLQLANKSVGHNPSFVVGRRALTLCLSACGEREKARAEAKRLQSLDPSEHLYFYRTRSPYQQADDIERICKELGAVGVTDQP
ncbi:MAG: hypothetical protein ACR2PZ_24620 [Pseudomonadales bacterium]